MTRMQKAVEILQDFQQLPYAPLRCENDPLHSLLIPGLEDDVAILVCPNCTYRRTVDYKLLLNAVTQVRVHTALKDVTNSLGTISPVRVEYTGHKLKIQG